MNPTLLLCVRVAVAAVWIVEGLWVKVLQRAPDELVVARSVVSAGPLSPETLLTLIGWSEALLGIGVLTGAYCRRLAWFQILLLVTMNALGVLLGGGAIEDPLRLAARNLPFLLYMLILAVHGPGAWAFRAGRSP